ncbi:copper resistance protein NlpE N-terminal domain-containing protein [Acinetobacter venetianus]|uniref:copper resistance protein NlpE n=1 Tax=Acinetobacter venetianus TaxID=52133 RepID=UPI000775D0AA|nr:copper resistance protein NlpE [Acinetobacter venetianus]KXO76835.1 copper resistance protein NlpE [Acinetobacter venetianus]QNH50317.1 copper resistance protein NlpE N-terminal domain-containing protein [Acinetobacter venetianus]
MKKSIIALSLASVFLVACSKADNKNNQEQAPTATSEAVAVDSAHTAENSLDWNGTYKGVLPCADCEGIETELELNADKTYELKETYLGKGDGKAFESKGSFQFDANNTSVIELDKTGDNRKYFVAEGYLKALDMEGNEITGDLADKYELKKEAE